MREPKKRLFIAINLPRNIKSNIAAEIEKIRYKFTTDIRFLEPQSWHITLIFLGYQPEESIPDILKAMEESANKFSAPSIELTSINYGPLGKTPRMIWLNGSPSTSKSLSPLRDSLENGLLDGDVRFKQEHRGFKTHITLARLQSAAKKDLPTIDQSVNWNFTSETLDLMESHLARSGAQYFKLASVDYRP